MAGLDPPDPELTSTVFNALAAMTYDSTAMAFKDANNNLIYMFVERGQTTEDTRWFYAKDSDGGTSPRGQIPQITYDVVHGGTLNTQTQKISYAGKSYRIRIFRDYSTGKQLAKAIEVP